MADLVWSPTSLFHAIATCQSVVPPFSALLSLCVCQMSKEAVSWSLLLPWFPSTVLSLYIYVCIHTHTHTHTHTHVYIWIYTHVCEHLNTYLYTYTPHTHMILFTTRLKQPLMAMANFSGIFKPK